MTDEDRCGAMFTDELSTSDARYRCIYETGHHGPHHSHGTTWGGPADWGIKPVSA